MMHTFRTVRLEPAFDDPELLRDIAEAHAPYPAPTSGYNDPPHATRLPWFKASWSPGGERRIPAAETILHNPRFIEAAKEVFGAAVVRPDKILVNVVGPMPALPAHVDPPAFRGTDRWPAPTASNVSRFVGPRTLIGLMGNSGLFEAWRISSATAVAWLYSGTRGEYVYWPDGPDGPACEEPPKPNVALVGDNDRMFHAIGAVGEPDRYLAKGTITPGSQLWRTPKGWAIVEGDDVRADYDDDDVRISIVWKATCFGDEAEASAYDDHTDDITVDQVVDIFSRDLGSRGIAVTPPGDPLTDHGWFRKLLSTYGFPKRPDQTETVKEVWAS